MKKCLLSVLICFVILPASSQSGMLKGYIVNEKGDTLRGEAKINPKKEVDNYNKVTFKDVNGVQKMYRPTKIKAYGFNDNHFVSMDSEDERKFYMVLARGAINFYKLGYEGLRMNEPVFELEYYISGKEEDDLTLVKESKFKKQLAEWMKDNTEFIDAYGDEKKLNVEKAVEAISQYNSWKASQ